jgi:hypothetical protein
VYLGLLGMVQFLPVLCSACSAGSSPTSGPSARTVIATQIAAGLLALILGGLDYFHVVAVWHIFVLAFLLGLVNAVDMPPASPSSSRWSGRDDIANAVALNSAVFNGARIVGPAIGGILIGLLGTALCFILNGLSYGAVVIGLLAMRDSELMPADRLAMPRSVSAVRSEPRRRPAIRLAHAGRAAGDRRDRLRLDLRHELQRRPAGHGGGRPERWADRIRAPVRVDGRRGADGRPVRRHAQRPRLRILVGGGMVLGSPNSCSRHELVSGRAGRGLLRRAGRIATAISANSLIQITVPGPLRGRVMSVYTTVFAGSTPIGNGLTGGFGGFVGHAGGAGHERRRDPRDDWTVASHG